MVERYRRIWPDVTADMLHIAGTEVLRVADRYSWEYNAAFRHDPAMSLASIDVPIALIDAEFDMLVDKDSIALDLNPNARLVVLRGLQGQPHLRAPGVYAREIRAFIEQIRIEQAVGA